MKYLRLFISLFLLALLPTMAVSQIAPIKKKAATAKTAAKGGSFGENASSKSAAKRMPKRKPSAGTTSSKRKSTQKTRLDYDHYSQRLEKAAANGDSEAQLALSWMYLTGDGVAESNTTAAYWMQKAADSGNTDAFSGMGLLWENGIGVDSVDMSKAMDWYQKAADRGDSFAQCALANIFMLVYHYSLADGETDTANDAGQAALDYYVKSANQNYAPAMYKLGLMNANGYYVAQNDATAVQWFYKGAQLDDEDCVYAIGYFTRYERGGLKNDEKGAFECFKFASEHGNTAATNELGLSYQFGSGVTKDERKAMELYAQAANAGNDEARYNWAYCTYYGIGVDRPNKETALEIMEEAAENGNMSAVDFMCEYQNKNFAGEGMVSVAGYSPKNAKRCFLRGTADGLHVIAVSSNDEFIRLDFQCDVSNTTSTSISRDTWIRDEKGNLAQLVYALNIKIYPGQRWHGSDKTTHYFSLYFHKHSIKGKTIDFAESGSDWKFYGIPLPGKRDKDKLDW